MLTTKLPNHERYFCQKRSRGLRRLVDFRGAYRIWSSRPNTEWPTGKTGRRSDQGTSADLSGSTMPIRPTVNKRQFRTNLKNETDQTDSIPCSSSHFCRNDRAFHSRPKCRSRGSCRPFGGGSWCPRPAARISFRQYGTRSPVLRPAGESRQPGGPTLPSRWPPRHVDAPQCSSH